MLGFVKNILGAKANPIGIDFGSDSLKLAQVALSGGEWSIIGAASADVPSHVRHDPTARLNFFIQTTRDLLASGGFTGRSAVLGLPSASMFIQHLRVPKMDEEALRKALPWEARGKIPIDPSRALLRHHIAGDIYQDQEVKQEVILMAASRELVQQLLSVASKSKIDVVGMNVEPKAIIDCFAHLYRRKNDADLTAMFIDIGAAGTRAFVARSGQLLFARAIPVGGDHITRSVATTMGIKVDESKLLRLNVCGVLAQAAAAQTENPRSSVPGGAAAGNESLSAPRLSGEVLQQAQQVEQASREILTKLVRELDLCRRYYEATFPNKPVDRLIFVGGEAKHRTLCQFVAQELGLPAQVGDPMARMGKNSIISPDSGIDRRQPQPNWSVAIGLSLGPISGTLEQTVAA